MKKLLNILLVITQLLIYPNIGFGQEVAKNRVFVMSDWSGGLATKLSDQSLNPKYAQIAENVRLDDELHSIAKRSQLYTFGTADASEQITSMHRLYMSNASKKLIVTHGDELETANDTTGAFTSILTLPTADYRWTWVTWHDLAMGGDGYNQPIKTDGTNATYLGTCFGVDSGAGAGPVAGTYSYKVSFYTTSYEVIFNVASSSVVNGAGDHDISLSMIPIGPTTYLGEAVTGRKIYRNKLADQTHWFLLSNGTIANNTVTILTDSDTDAGLTATAYPAGTATWTPPKGKFHLIHKNRLFIADNPTYPSRIYFSKDGNHDLFETSIDYFDIRANDGDEITGIFNLLGILRVFKTNTIQSLYTSGDDPQADWSISDPFSFVGCDAPYSTVSTPLGIMYLSKNKNGIYVFNGQSSQLKSEIVTPVINDILASNLNNVCSVYNNNLYYMAYASTTVGGSTNNRVLIYSVLSNAFMIDTLNINSFCSFSGGGDGGVLYAGASDTGKVYQYSNVAKQFIHSRHTDFTGTFTDSRYIPIDAGGDQNSPIIELAWDCTIDGWSADILAKDATWDGTIDDISTHLTDATIDRPEVTGNYIAQVLNTPGASTYDKIYWNETLAAGTDATFAIRSGATSAACIGAAWSAEYSTAAGSDISGLTANEYTQYRITLTTSDTDVSPYVNTIGGFTVKLSYNTVGTAAESAIALHWQTGYMDFQPGYIKSLRKIIVTHSGTNGTLNIKFTNEYNESDIFSIDLNTYPTRYESYFTNGSLIGNKFKVDITNSDLNSIKIQEIILIYDIDPMV